jgi:hypothetical protein
MPKGSTVEIIRAGRLEEHPAIESWRVLQPGRIELQGIEILKEREKSGVYRIVGAGPGGSAVIAKQCWYKSALIERTIYEAVLPYLPLPCLHFYGFVQSDDDWGWLFVEDAGGEEYSPQIEEHRLLAARWLGIMHTAAARLAATSELPDRGPYYYLARLQLVHGVIQQVLANVALNTDNRIILESIASQCDLLITHWGQIEQMCNAIPRTVVHGDFAGKNLRVRTSPSGIVLLAFDWEIAGWGLPTVDLATADLARYAGDSAAFSISPEIGVYQSIVSQFWTQLGAHDMRVLANLGIIFRQIDAIKWACEGLVERPAKAMETFLGSFRFYQDKMASAIQAITWEH